MMNTNLTKNEQLQALAIEIYRLASNDDTMSFDKAEELIKVAATKTTEEKLDLNKLCALYPVLEGRLRYVYSLKDEEISNGRTTSFDGKMFWFKASKFTEAEAIDLARTLNNGEKMIKELETKLNYDIMMDDNGNEARLSAIAVCSGFDAYLNPKDNYMGSDLLEMIKRKKNELV
jgi:hypothetical protein